MAHDKINSVDNDAPISKEVMLQLINSSIQSGHPLYLVQANLSGHTNFISLASDMFTVSPLFRQANKTAYAASSRSGRIYFSPALLPQRLG